MLKRHMSEAGLASMLKQFEGCRLKAYRNFKNEPWTIGWGATRWLDGAPVKEGQICTQQEADALLRRDLEYTEAWVDKFLVKTFPGGIPCPQWVFDGQVSLAYNIGGSAWANSTQLKKLNSGFYLHEPTKPSPKKTPA